MNSRQSAGRSSGPYVDAILQSGLDATSKTVLIAVVMSSNSHGDNLWAGVPRLAQLASKSMRTVERALYRLREMEILSPLGYQRGSHFVPIGGRAPGGAGWTVRYRFNVDELPLPAARPQARARKTPPPVTGLLPPENPAIRDEEPRHPRQITPSLVADEPGTGYLPGSGVLSSEPTDRTKDPAPLRGAASTTEQKTKTKTPSSATFQLSGDVTREVLKKLEVSEQTAGIWFRGVRFEARAANRVLVVAADHELAEYLRRNFSGTIQRAVVSGGFSRDVQLEFLVSSDRNRKVAG